MQFSAIIYTTFCPIIIVKVSIHRKLCPCHSKKVTFLPKSVLRKNLQLLYVRKLAYINWWIHLAQLKSLPSSKNIGSVWSSSNRRHLFCLCRWFLKTMFPICHFCKQKASKICTLVQGTFKLLLRLVSPECIIGALLRPYYSRVSQPNCMFNDLNWQHDKDLADGPGHLAVILEQKRAHITLHKHLCHYP